MSKHVLATQGLDGWVRIALPKGCMLKMPTAHYEAAISAGKAETRALRQASREAAGQAAQEAARLAWIEEQGP